MTTASIVRSVTSVPTEAFFDTQEQLVLDFFLARLDFSLPPLYLLTAPGIVGWVCLVNILV